MSTKFQKLFHIKYYFYILFISWIHTIISTGNDEFSPYNRVDVRGDKSNGIKEINLLSFSDLYFVNLGIGKPNDQHFQLLIDTQHKEISVMSKNCTACKNIPVFDEDRSSTFQVESTNQTLQVNNYEFHGRGCSDAIDLAGAINFSRYPFFLVDEVTRTTSMKFEGYFGLGFTKNKEDNFVYNLKKNGYINDAIYSILLLPQGQDSKLYLGGYDKKLINDTDAEKIFYTNISFNEDSDNKQVEWYISTDSVYVNSYHIEQEQRIVLNSGSNIIRMPKAFFFQNIKNIFNKESQCQMWTDNVFHCKCDSDYQTMFPTFKFTFDDNKHNITITPEDYTVLDYSINLATDSSAYCLLYLSINYSNDYWLLGNNFINNFYTIYDVENSRIGFYDIRNIDVAGLQDILMLGIIIVSSSILFFFIIYCVYKKYIERAIRTDQLLP